MLRRSPPDGSYVYDTETQLYYLQSRYYNPTIGRFLNADALVSTGQGLLGNNMFTYCLNNPICRKDIGGAVSQSVFDNEFDPTDDDREFGHGYKGDNGNGSNSPPGGSQSGSSFQKGLPSEQRDGILPKEHYTDKKVPKNGTPGSTYENYRFNDHTKQWEYSEARYDFAGRQTMRIDWTNHGRADHGNPHCHYYLYDGRYPNGIEIRIDCR